ncbi:hypothetical protein Bequi_13060 [Brachybacterium sp. JHP9]|uniref:SLH domain-containing protein n=1 Tax=Brachybacterium equifaecis TaxID=2910770 RepID=A0ABT0R4V7_9MICO|nr:hypothetical protein [Brachybacterium equifaecis]MCL6424294.1 hypothetical protein [Brachybacterium equifaecis]
MSAPPHGRRPQRRAPRRRSVLGGAARASALLPVAVLAAWIGLPLARLSRGEPAAAPDPDPVPPAVTAPAPAFRDAPSGELRRAVERAAELGTLAPLAPGVFAPGELLSREELALALHRFAGSPGPLPEFPSYTDLPEGEEARAACRWLHAQAADWGDGALRFRGESEATLGDAAGILRGLLDARLERAGFGIPVPADPAPLAWLAAAGLLPAPGLLPAADGAESPVAAGAPLTRGAGAIILLRLEGVVQS